MDLNSTVSINIAELSHWFTARTGYPTSVHSCTTVTVLSIISPMLELVCVEVKYTHNFSCFTSRADDSHACIRIFTSGFHLHSFNVQGSKRNHIAKWFLCLLYILQDSLNKRNKLCNSIRTENEQKADMNYSAVIPFQDSDASITHKNDVQTVCAGTRTLTWNCWLTAEWLLFYSEHEMYGPGFLTLNLSQNSLAPASPSII